MKITEYSKELGTAVNVLIVGDLLIVSAKEHKYYTPPGVWHLDNSQIFIYETNPLRLISKVQLALSSFRLFAAIQGTDVALYAGDFFGKVQVVNLNDPHNPIITASITLEGGTGSGYRAVGGFAKIGTFLYITMGTYGIGIFDCANPFVPVSLKTIDTPNNAKNIIANKNFLYVSDGNNLIVYSIPNFNPVPPAPPPDFDAVDLELIRTYPISLSWMGLFGTQLFIFGASIAEIYDVYNGVELVKISNIPKIAPLGDSSGSKVSGAKDGNFLYIAHSYTGLAIFDIFNINMPTWIDTVSIPNFAVDVVVSSDKVYLASGGSPNYLSAAAPLITVVDKIVDVDRLELVKLISSRCNKETI